MYRIHRVFDNSSTVLIKIAGDVLDCDLVDWTGFLNLLGSWGNRDIILDFCEVAHISPLALTVFVDRLSQNVRLINCSQTIKNALCSFGLADRLLDGDTKNESLKLRWPV
jgi:hypothetical protein